MTPPPQNQELKSMTEMLPSRPGRLKPCAHCGNAAEVELTVCDFKIYCPKCLVKVVCDSKDPTIAIEAWNKRANDSKPASVEGLGALVGHSSRPIPSIAETEAMKRPSDSNFNLTEDKARLKMDIGTAQEQLKTLEQLAEAKGCLSRANALYGAQADENDRTVKAMIESEKKLETKLAAALKVISAARDEEPAFNSLLKKALEAFDEVIKNDNRPS